MRGKTTELLATEEKTNAQGGSPHLLAKNLLQLSKKEKGLGLKNFGSTRKSSRGNPNDVGRLTFITGKKHQALE